MYRTKKLLKWVDETVIRYALYLKIEKPKIFYDFDVFLRKGVLNTWERLHWRMQISMGNTIYGAAHKSINMIYLNIPARKRTEYSSLESTIVHELVHLKYPKKDHTKRFFKLIEETLKKG